MRERYEARAAAHTADRDAERRVSVLLSRARLLTFVPGLALLLWALGRGLPAVPLASALVLLAVFAVLVVWHARVEDRAAWFDALREFNLFGVARLDRAWDRLPPADPPAGVDLAHHPYANDLDLFGRASLMQWLGPAATAPGTRTLQRWLLAAAPPADIRDRQAAVVALAGAHEWRELLGGHGRLAAAISPAELDKFLAWTEAPGPYAPARVRQLRLFVRLLTLAIWLLLFLHAAGWVTGAYWLLPMTVGIVLSFALAPGVHGQFTRAGAGESAFQRYAELFEHATAAPSAGGLLADIRDRLSADGAQAPRCMRRLNRILGFAQLRAGAGILHFPIQALTLWDFHVFFVLDDWRRRVGPRVRGWMAALGDLDALSALAHAAADNPAWAMPTVDRHEAALVAAGIGHPLIPDARRVGNDVTVGPPGTLLLITGSNMSGKSTLLRAIGLNTVLAQAGGPVCATAMRLPPVELETSIRVQDSLEQGLSYFMAALARLKGVVERSQRLAAEPDAPRVLYLLDEILQGTNTAERAIAVRGIARHLLRAGAIGVMTTHDLGIAREEPLDTAAELVHFTEIVDAAGAMTFDYRLRPGIATSRNALRLMHLIGLHLDEPPAPPVR